MQITVPNETVVAIEEKTARKYASQVTIPGFRAGKAPAGMVRKRFGDAIRQEAVEQAINDAFREAIDREGLKLATQPHIHDLKSEPGKPLEFELHCELRPELSLDRVSGFSLSRLEAVVTDEVVEEQIERLREQKGDWSPVDGKPSPGDMVSVLLSTADDDGTMPEPREYRIVLGGGQAIAGIEEVIMEAAPGQTVERAVRWPDDFPDEAQRGVSKMVRVVLNDVKRKALPALDDDFAREVGDFDTLDALRAAVRTDLTTQRTREADAEVRGQLIERIVEANPFEVPTSWVRQLMDGYLRAYGVPDTEKQRFAEEFRPMAERQVRRDLIIDTLAEREGLKAGNAEIDAKVEELAKARNVDPGQVYTQLEKAGRIPELERDITEERVFTWLLERNPVASATGAS